MEGYLIRLPNDAWRDERQYTERRWRRITKAQVLYFVLEEGYLKGYIAPGDPAPMVCFELTTNHIEVEAFFAVNMFRVFATKKSAPLLGTRVPDVPSSMDEDSSSDSDSGSDDEDDGDDERTAGNTSSILLFAASEDLLKHWGTRILNWNRYVFPSDTKERMPSVLDLAKAELVAAFHQHNCHEHFSRSITLVIPQPPVPREGNDHLPVTENAPFTTSISVDGEVVKPISTVKAEEATRPWWLVNMSSLRRVSSQSLLSSK